MHSLAKTSSNLGGSNFADTPAKQTSYQQTDILKSIELLGDKLRYLPLDTTLGSSSMEAFNQLIDVINNAPSRDQNSGFDGETTNRVQNLYLLSTAVDSANITDENKAILLEIINAELAKNKDAETYFSKVAAEEKKIASQPTRTAKTPSLFSSSSQRILNIGHQQFSIEHTTGNMRNDCLAYALQSDNRPLAKGYRAALFTAEKIERQLNRFIQWHAHNGLANSEDDPTTDLALVIGQVKEGYDVAIPADINSIQKLSEILARHIQATNCMLDSFTAAGIFAETYKHPIIIVSKNKLGASVFAVINFKGAFIHQGTDLKGLDAEIANAKYVYNPAGFHFERMVPIGLAR